MSEPSGIAALGINIHTLITQLVNFFVLLVLLWFVAYKPILRMLNERKQKIAESMELAEKNHKEAELIEERNQLKIKETKEQALKIVEESRQQLKKDLADTKTKVEEEAQKIITKAKTDAENERLKMIKELKSQLASLILLASGKLANKSLKVEVQNQLVDEVIEDLEKKNL